MLPRTLIALALLATACDPVPAVDTSTEAPRLNREIAFRVNDHPVYQDVFELAFEPQAEQIIEQYAFYREEIQKNDTMSAEELETTLFEIDRAEEAELGRLRMEVRDGLAQKELVYQYALSEGYEPDHRVRIALQEEEKLQVIQLMFETLFEQEISEEELQAWYEEKKVHFLQTLIDARQLTVADDTVANELRTQLDQGADFEALVSTYSIDDFKDQQGKLHEEALVPIEALPSFLVEMLQGQEIGDTVGPMQVADDEWVLYFVMDRQDTAPPLEDIRAEIEDAAKKDRLQGLVEQIEADSSFTDDSTVGSPPVETLP